MRYAVLQYFVHVSPDPAKGSKTRSDEVTYRKKNTIKKRSEKEGEINNP